MIKTNVLKPNTNYELNAEDINFSVQLAKVGSVHFSFKSSYFN